MRITAVNPTAVNHVIRSRDVFRDQLQELSGQPNTYVHTFMFVRTAAKRKNTNTVGVLPRIQRI